MTQMRLVVVRKSVERRSSEDFFKGRVSGNLPPRFIILSKWFSVRRCQGWWGLAVTRRGDRGVIRSGRLAGFQIGLSHKMFLNIQAIFLYLFSYCECYITSSFLSNFEHSKSIVSLSLESLHTFSASSYK